MSVIGPRPGLWNQDMLTAERDKYGANNIKGTVLSLLFLCSGGEKYTKGLLWKKFI